MTGPRDRDGLTVALHQLRGAVRERVTPPPAARLRARAIRALRVRRTAAALAGATAVAALAVGGFQVVQLTAHQPVPPAGTPSPAGSPTPPEVPEVTPSPRPAPLPPSLPDDPITQVDWRSATITLPARAGCPDGTIDFVAVSDIYPNAMGPVDGEPWLSIDATQAAYGDLTGDGRAEAVLAAGCFTSESSGDGAPTLLVVARAADGTLAGLGHVGALGTMPLAWWVEDGALLVDADPSVAGPDDHFPAVPGLALRYQWTGSGFTGWEPAEAYPPIVPLDPAGTGPPVRPRAVAAALGCPDEELRFTRDEHDWGGTATAGGATFTTPARFHQRYLFDLDHTGSMLLVTALQCTDVDGWTRRGLAVFERSGDGWRGISVLQHGPGAEAEEWSQDVDSLVLAGVDLLRVGWSGAGNALPYRWTGTVLELDDSQG